MQNIKLSDLAIQEIIMSLNKSTADWMTGMPPGTTLPYSNDVKNMILKQIVEKP